VAFPLLQTAKYLLEAEVAQQAETVVVVKEEQEEEAVAQQAVFVPNVPHLTEITEMYIPAEDVKHSNSNTTTTTITTTTTSKTTTTTTTASIRRSMFILASTLDRSTVLEETVCAAANTLKLSRQVLHHARHKTGINIIEAFFLPTATPQ
jgi:hypothetical protein